MFRSGGGQGGGREGRPPHRLQRGVALGGVTAARLPEVAAMGFGGAAVLGGVWGADDPVAAVEDLLRRCDALRGGGGGNGGTGGGGGTGGSDAAG